jgi:Ca2+-transporting ATPase
MGNDLSIPGGTAARTGPARRVAAEGGGDAAPAWHALAPAEVLTRTMSAPAGLAADEAARRLAAHGPNLLLRAAPDPVVRILWRQLDDPLIWVLVGAAALAGILGKGTDAAVVAAVVVVNAIIGFFQEYRATRAIEALAGMVPERATVLRGGERISIPAAEVVPGDVLLLAAGDQVPADVRLLAAKGLRIEEAALTGESAPAAKGVAPVEADAPLGDRTSMAFAGTLTVAGTGDGVVVATGGATELGRISGLLRQAEPLATPLTRALAQVGRLLTGAILAVTAILLAVGTARSVAQGVPLADAAREMLVFAVALAVGAIPEGLPAIVTIALAIGVQRMAARRAIVRRLPAVETLGATTIICTDKTGTLTRNEMTVSAIWTPAGRLEVEGTGYAPEGRFVREGAPVSPPPEARALLEAAALCNDASLREEAGGWEIVGDPTEAALVVAAEKAGLDVEALRRAAPRLDALPFDPEVGYMATLHGGGGFRVLVKGAPEVVLRRCAALAGGAPLEPVEIQAEVDALAAGGLRVLAVAERRWERRGASLASGDVASGLVLLGFAGMIDPPRPGAIAAVRACAAAGVRVKMITGDHRGTAEAIARALGIPGGAAAVTGAELSASSDAELGHLARRANVFARVAPEHKLRLVRALQEQGEVVAMTGDGVNDAPALKRADIGVAMGIAGTSVAREASDMVLTDDDFATIVAAVEEGRRVHDNLVKSLAFVLPTNLGLALLFVLAVLFFPFDAATRALLLPVRPAQLLWVNLVAAVGLALPLALEAPERDAMQRPPRPPRAPILSRLVLSRTAVAAVVMAGGAVGLFLLEWSKALAAGVDSAAALADAQTMAVTAVVFFQVFYMLECRSLRGSMLRTGFRSNPAVAAGVLGILALHAVFVFAPPFQAIFGTRALGPWDLVEAALVGAVIVPLMAIVKTLESRRERR